MLYILPNIWEVEFGRCGPQLVSETPAEEIKQRIMDLNVRLVSVCKIVGSLEALESSISDRLDRR